jgi:hypothetical protein
MSRIKRPTPRRNPNRYPVGTLYRFRDGRTARVRGYLARVWVDPTLGNGGGNFEERLMKEWVPND